MTIETTESRKANILIVDDTPDNLRFLAQTLEIRGYEVQCALSGALALRAAKLEPPDLILLDIKMPGMDGYEVCQQFKRLKETQEIPVIFISALDEVLDKVKAFQVGGVDYITKPFQEEEVLVRIENHLMLQAAKQEISQLNLELEKRVQERTAELAQEIKQHQQTQQQLLHIALHDELTGLPNRSLLIERLKESLKAYKANPSQRFAVLFLDCDRFKVVNDSLGHSVGDRLLCAIASRLRCCLRLGDTLARLGGDEFTILLENIEQLEDVLLIVRSIQSELQYPFKLEHQDIFIDMSIGIAMVNEDYQQAEHLLRDADAAMYQAKRAGKSCYQVFQPEMYRNALIRFQAERDLRHAIERQEFRVYYQPLISLMTGQLTGFEALVRWHHPERGLVSPGEFIDIAEETGFIVPIGFWVLREACAQFQTWQDTIAIPSNLTLSVNLSVKQFAQPNLLDWIDSILKQTNIKSQQLKLEITESVILENTASVQGIFNQLHQRKILLAIDDFGTGYSSLSYLHRFPMDTLKIDRSFVDFMTQSPVNLGIVKTIINLAHQLGMSVVAEGIETEHQARTLQEMGCEEGQGFLFSKPLPVEAATELLQQFPVLLVSRD
ncbi:EAL domain-containing protein [Spirulina subsalsa FACHB-351]|uniref:EAL domain-containing protein n=1 Tax=Spirulina subsalsa FACHB-351 TaxID=234711 RepID=A0ABT3L0V1_9CYAN|nr:GGDEF domain-containing response regulator [Spirulina subsalsa]MCW6035102.1 EAL domain-containing protein [Spirulina subsalsa FACHB-351]